MPAPGSAWMLVLVPLWVPVPAPAWMPVLAPAWMPVLVAGVKSGGAPSGTQRAGDQAEVDMPPLGEASRGRVPGEVTARHAADNRKPAS